MTFEDIMTGKLTLETLQKIVHALNYYVEVHEDKLSQQNASDTDWERVKEYKDIATDIEFFVLTSKNRL